LFRIVIFAVAGVVIFMKFRRGLRSFHTHAPYVFAAFEILLLLMFINLPFMSGGTAPSWRQGLSWILLSISAAFAISGFYAIKKHGKARGDWENTTELVKRGIFGYIRHPLYSSLMLLAAGFLFKDVTVLTLILCIISLTLLAAASVVEERENIAKFGGIYRAYAAETKRYIPFIL